VSEGGLRFLVNLTTTSNTGSSWITDSPGGLIREFARGQALSHLFAYTVRATVYAADGGATSTTTVDLSASTLTGATQSALNGFTGAAHSFVRAIAGSG